MPSAVLDRLAERDNVVAIKYAVPDVLAFAAFAARYGEVIEAMAMLGVIEPTVRPPLALLSEADRSELAGIVEGIAATGVVG